MRPFTHAVRALAVIALLTGAGDVIVGLSGQRLIGAALEEGYADPLLNSQIRYLGAIWLGFGLLLWMCSRDVARHTGLIRGALWIVILGGVGRLISVVQFGLPAAPTGAAFVIGAIVIELVLMPLLLVWLRRLPAQY